MLGSNKYGELLPVTVTTRKYIDIKGILIDALDINEIIKLHLKLTLIIKCSSYQCIQSLLLFHFS